MSKDNSDRPFSVEAKPHNTPSGEPCVLKWTHAVSRCTTAVQRDAGVRK